MEKKIREKNVSLYGIFCVVIVAVTMFPLSCNYIMTGGIIQEWIARVAEIAAGLENGSLFLFPSAELLINMGENENAMNSNLWFILPGVLYALFDNMVAAYRIFMVLIQVGTAVTAYLFFCRIFAEKEKGISVLFGLLLYMTNPYRIAVCYDMANMNQAVIWMLMPLYAWALVGILRDSKGIKDIVIAAVALAGIGYADVKLFLFFMGIAVLPAIIKRKAKVVGALASGMLLFLPGLYRLLQYLFMGRFQELGLSQQVIMENGYRFGEFFTGYTWKAEHPGMGMGIFLCLMIGLWLKLVNNQSLAHKESNVFLIMAVVFAAMSLCSFPWDFVQRLGGWALKFVSLLESPGLFFGMAVACLCVPGARCVQSISMHDNKWIATVLPVIVILFCIGGCIYQCNMLTYSRIPMDIF